MSKLHKKIHHFVGYAAIVCMFMSSRSLIKAVSIVLNVLLVPLLAVWMGY